MMVTVDVVIPCYNYARYLEQCVESVLAQSQLSIRVLVLDDCSTDASPELGQMLARRDSRVTFVRHRRNRGHILTYNEGIEWATGDYFLLLSADDYLLPGALARATKLMDSDTKIVLVYGSAVRLQDDGKYTLVGKMPGPGRVMLGQEWIRACGGTNFVPTPTAVVRTWAQKDAGGYSPNLPISGDMEMWLRLATRGSVGFIQSSQAVYRRHGSNMSVPYSTLADLQERKKALDHFFRYSGTMVYDSERVYAQAIKSLARTAIGAAGLALDHGDRTATQELLDLGLKLSPALVGSPCWLKFEAKRMLHFVTAF